MHATFARRIDDEAQRLWERLRRATPRELMIAGGVAGAALLITPPLLIVAIPLLIATAVYMIVSAFARAWVREFSALMNLGDDAFPGAHDKLIWAMLLIVLPPVGIRLFRGFRQAHRPESKPSAARDWF